MHTSFEFKERVLVLTQVIRPVLSTLIEKFLLNPEPCPRFVWHWGEKYTSRIAKVSCSAQFQEVLVMGSSLSGRANVEAR